MKGKTVEIDGEALFVPDPGPFSLDYRIFSDSILLFAYGDTFDHFFRTITAAHRLLASGFAGHKAPLRGAIGYGDLIMDNNSIWIGSAIEDAYVGESKQVWSGCALTTDCALFAEQQGYLQAYQDFWSSYATQQTDPIALEDVKKAKKRIVKYPIPEQINPKAGAIEYSTREGYVLDWTLKMYEGAGTKAFPATANPHALRIIENTKQFEEWARQYNR